MQSNQKNEQEHGLDQGARFQQFADVVRRMQNEDIGWNEAEEGLNLQLVSNLKYNPDEQDDELDALVAFALGEQGIDVPKAVKPNLSFLNSTSSTDEQSAVKPLYYLQQAKQLVVELSAEALQAWQSVVPSLQSDALSPALAGTRQSQGKILYQSSIDDIDRIGAEGYEKIDIQIVEEANDKNVCTIRLEITFNESEPFGAGPFEVILKYHEQPLDQQWSDGYGHTFFKRVEVAHLPELVFEIVAHD